MPVAADFVRELVAMAVGAEAWRLAVAVIEIATLQANFSHCPSLPPLFKADLLRIASLRDVPQTT